MISINYRGIKEAVDSWNAAWLSLASMWMRVEGTIEQVSGAVFVQNKARRLTWLLQFGRQRNGKQNMENGQKTDRKLPNKGNTMYNHTIVVHPSCSREILNRIASLLGFVKDDALHKTSYSFPSSPSISTLDVHQHIRYLDILVILIINHNLHQ